MILKIYDLDRAAFLCLIGAEVVQVTGSYPRFVYHLSCSKEDLALEKRDKRVVYFEYMKLRNHLKRGAGKIDAPTDNGETERLHKISTGWKLKDVATFKYTEHLKRLHRKTGGI